MKMPLALAFIFFLLFSVTSPAAEGVTKDKSGAADEKTTGLSMATINDPDGYTNVRDSDKQSDREGESRRTLYR